MGLVYQDDEDLHFLQHCSEEQLKIIAGLLTHDDKGKQRLNTADGFALVLSGAKLWLERGLLSDFIGDRHPDGI